MWGTLAARVPSSPPKLNWHAVEFRLRWDTLTEDQQEDVACSVGLLEELGSTLGFPHSSKVSRSRYAQMRELRTQSAGSP